MPLPRQLELIHTRISLLITRGELTRFEKDYLRKFLNDTTASKSLTSLGIDSISILVPARGITEAFIGHALDIEDAQEKGIFLAPAISCSSIRSEDYSSLSVMCDHLQTLILRISPSMPIHQMRVKSISLNLYCEAYPEMNLSPFIEHNLVTLIVPPGKIMLTVALNHCPSTSDLWIPVVSNPYLVCTLEQELSLKEVQDMLSIFFLLSDQVSSLKGWVRSNLA